MIPFLVLYIPMFKPQKIANIYLHTFREGNDRAEAETLPGSTHGWARFDSRQIIERNRHQGAMSSSSCLVRLIPLPFIPVCH